MTTRLEMPPDAPRPPRLRVRGRAGRCYELCAKVMLDTDEWTLVHGIARGPSGAQIGHAWLRQGAWVYDPTIDCLAAEQWFMRRLAAVPIVEYTQQTAAQEMVLHRHSGPWIDLSEVA